MESAILPELEPNFSLLRSLEGKIQARGVTLFLHENLYAYKKVIEIAMEIVYINGPKFYTYVGKRET